ncbi:hypothetical protein ACE6H2_019874 [Prunus campanulata]
MRCKTSTSSEHGGAMLGRYCKCRKEALIMTSWTYLNSGRLFYVCGTQGRLKVRFVRVGGPRNVQSFQANHSWVVKAYKNHGRGTSVAES